MEKLEVLYEDNHIIVVVKPVNIPSQGDKTGDIDMLTIIKEYIKEKYNKPGDVYLGLVHRLDRPTGLLYFSFMYSFIIVSISISPVLSPCEGILTGLTTTIM